LASSGFILIFIFSNGARLLELVHFSKL